MSNDKEDKRMNTTIKRPTTPAESLKQSFKEVKLIQEGKLPKKSWRELYNELKNEK